MSMVSPFVVGVDTHARTHTFAVVNTATGELIQTQTFPTTKAGLVRARAWITRTADTSAVIAVEGSGSYGAPLTRLLHEAGFRVAEMDAPVKRNHKHGKSDPLDAEDIARRALATLDRLGQPRAIDGQQGALQVLLSARSSIATARTATINQLTALLRRHELGVDARRSLTTTQIRTINAWRARTGEEVAIAAARAEAIRLAKEIQYRDSQLAHNETQLLQHVRNITPHLLENRGIGPVSAARVLTAFSHPGRIRSEAAFARLAGVAPIPASSGNTTRHRLHRGGDRELNSALWRIAFYRYHHDPETTGYVTRKLAEGHTPKEIIRCLKRYIARNLYRQLQTQTT